MAPSGDPARDDDLKRMLQTTPADRCDEAYLPGNGEAQALQELLSKHYLQPKETDLDLSRQAIIDGTLRNGKAAIVIPMRERGRVIRDVLTVLCEQIEPESILVVNDGSDDEAVHEVKRHETGLIWSESTLDLLDWGRLMQILNLKERPHGKGVAVLAGYIYHYLTARVKGRQPEWLIQNDAEIAEYRRYQCLQHLMYGMRASADALLVKMAKFGRTNERCMTARATLPILAESNAISPQSRQRASELFERLLPHKWMLTGEFAIRFNVAMQRPFATGYLEETLISAFVEDLAARIGAHTIQVANPNPRLDGDNDDRKEACMQQQISNFLVTLALEAPAVCDWTIESIADFNRTFMSRPITMGWIPPNDGPVKAEVLQQDRVIPSVEMLVQHGLLDVKKGLELIRQMQ